MKYKTIAALESALKEIEEAHCWAVLSNDRELAQETYQERGVILRELKSVGQ